MYECYVLLVSASRSLLAASLVVVGLSISCGVVSSAATPRFGKFGYELCS